jgi:hypothetical protein
MFIENLEALTNYDMRTKNGLKNQSAFEDSQYL